MENRRIIIVSILIMGFLAAGIFIYSASETQLNVNNPNKISVVVSIPPEAEFVEKVGGDKVKVTTMVPAGANPHTYEPLPEQLKEVSNAKMYVQVGSGLEFEATWMDKLRDTNKNMLVVNGSNGITFIPNQETDDHEGENHEHESESQYDTHVWVSPRNAKIMVENIYQGLVQVDPDNKDYYKSNKDKYLQELDNSDKSINETLSGEKNRKILVYHPAWGYFCRDYGFTQISIEKNGKEPTPQGMASLIDQAKKDNIKVIFISPQFNKNSAETVASEIGGQVVLIDDLDKNYIENLNKVAESFKNALK
jgi:zinc transport system substrate-binding protein